MTQRWDDLVGRTATGTFLHTRRFLSYHGERFADRSLLLLDESGEPQGAFPAALDPADASTVVSHPGITYGGLLANRALRGEKVMHAFEALLAFYRERGIRRIRYKAVPPMYHRWPGQDDLYALFRASALLYRRDFSAAIDLKTPQPWSERRRRAVKRARAVPLTVVHGSEHLPAYWALLTAVLESRHRVRPVHALQEIQVLAGRFPDEIRFIGARSESGLAAGIVLFKTDTVCHVQYSAASAVGAEHGALDLVTESAIEEAVAQGKAWFDFGVSTEAQGSLLNGGLHEFKCGFGAGGVTYDFYEVQLAGSSNLGEGRN
jgi:hypothetical protein